MALPKIGVEAVVDNLDGYKKAMKTIETSNDAASSNVAKTAKSFDVLGTASKAAGNILQSVFSTVLSGLVLKFLDVISNAIGSVISKIGDLVSGIFNAGVDFSKTMANISSVTNLTGGSLTKLSKDLIEIGADSAAGPQAVANAYYDVASGVLDASKRLDVLKAAIATSEAGQADLTATTQGLISVMNAYGDAAGGATKVSDVFTATVAQGVGTMDQFVGALSPLAGLAATQKISFTELGGAISYMTAKGIPAEQAATAIKAAMVQLSRNTPQVIRALRSVGEKSVSASIAAHGLAGTLELLEKGAKKTGQNFTQMIGSVEALQAANALGTDEFQKYFDTFIDGVDGATAAARELQRADVSYQLKLMQSRFQAVGLSIAGAVLPAFNKFLTFINTAFKNFDWKKIGAGLDKLGEKLGQTAEKIIGNIAQVLAGVDWEKLAGDIGTIIGNIGDFIASIDWTAIIQGASTFIGQVIQVAGEIGKFIASIDWAQVAATIQNALSIIGSVFREIFTQVGMFASTFSSIVGAVTTTFTAVVAAIQAAPANISGGFQMISDGLSSIWNGLFGPTGSVSTAVSTTFASIGTFITTAQANMSGGFQMISDGLGAIWNGLFGPEGSVSLAVSTAFASIGTFITTGQTNITIGIQAIVDAVTGIWEYYFGAEGQITQAVSLAMDTVTQFINDNITPIGAAISDIVTGVQSTWDTYFGPNGSISTAVGTALNNVATIVRGMASAIGAAFNAIAGAVMAALAPAIAAVNGLVSAARALLGMAGGGGGGGTPAGASGGNLQEGLNVVGEQGAEAVIKQGNKVTVIPHGKSREILATVGSNITPLSHQGQINPMKFLPKLDMGGVFHNISNISPQATPITAGATNHHWHDETTNNRNIGAIIFNGINNAEDAIARMSMLKAAKKF
jgi:TP901 family phage tail tape measure protein